MDCGVPVQVEPLLTTVKFLMSVTVLIAIRVTVVVVFVARWMSLLPLLAFEAAAMRKAVDVVLIANSAMQPPPITSG